MGFQACLHLREPGGGKRHVIDGAGAVERVEITVAEIIFQALRVVAVDADDVYDAGGFRILRTGRGI